MRLLPGLIILFFLNASVQTKKTPAKDYFPPYQSWQHLSTSSVFDTSALAQAVQYAIEHESTAPRNMELAQAMTFSKEPF